MSYYMDGEILVSFLLSLFTGIPSGIFAVVCYVLSSMALYTIAKRREISKAWLAWVPVLNCWVLGSLSDQYRYVVKGQNCSKRKWLLGLNITNLLLGLGLFCFIISMVVSAILGEGRHYDPMVFQLAVTFSLVGVIFLISIPAVIIRYVALYDVYLSLDPNNAVLFLVLSILINVVEPFFLFFSREKDTGMPPRRDQTAATPEPWLQDGRDYL